MPIVAVVLAALTLLASSEAPTFRDTISVDVVAGTDGRLVDVTATGFAPDTPVVLTLDQGRGADAAGPFPLELASLTADADGSISTSVTIPQEVPPGTYILRASGENPDGSAERFARQVRVGTSDAPPNSIAEVLRYVGYALAAFGVAVLLIFGGRWWAARRDG